MQVGLTRQCPTFGVFPRFAESTFTHSRKAALTATWLTPKRRKMQPSITCAKRFRSWKSKSMAAVVYWKALFQWSAEPSPRHEPRPLVAALLGNHLLALVG